ncbi:uncharacterized protein LOC123316475 [Coccinella septempunctata]|uniref:uncharacterized protein LOC123316475 n=1 Tax=Coccinella septempunctata TaxID=41139 RepID=UPI001D0810EC|nr:uncharacterized protein LOC123316475 [Coccinella septempunctata]
MSMPHICTIPHETSRTYLPYKEGSKNVFQRFYRCFRHWCMVWKGHPHFSHYYKSTTVYLEERKSHASSKYFYIIHPMSRLCFCMEVFYIFSYIYAFLYYPMLASFQDIYGTDYKFDETEKIFHVIFTLEIIARLFIGRTNFALKVITLDQRKIIRYSK